MKKLSLLFSLLLAVSSFGQTNLPNAGVFTTPERYFITGADAGCAKAKNATVNANGQLSLAAQTETSLPCGPMTGPSGYGTTASQSFSYGVVFTQGVVSPVVSATHTVITARARMGGGGLHSAMWLSGCISSSYFVYINCPNALINNSGYSEVDFVEVKPASTGLTTVLQNTFDITANSCSTTSGVITDVSQNYHTYQADITNSLVQFQIDGVNSNSCATHLPSTQMYLALGMSGMGTSQGTLTPTGSNISGVLIDYVKITVGGVTTFCYGTGTGGGAAVCSIPWSGIPSSPAVQTQ